MKARSSSRTLKKQQQQSILSTQNQTYKFDDEENSMKSWATLKDLCPEDKSKIGLLIQSLATAKEERQSLANELKDKTKVYRKSVKRIQEHSDRLIAEQKCTEEKFKESLDLLKEYQDKFDQTQQSESIKQKQLSPLPKKYSNKENQSSNFTKESEQQTDQFTFEDPIRIKQLLANLNQTSSDRYEVIAKKAGESEQKLKQARQEQIENKNISEFQFEKQIPIAFKKDQHEYPISEIQKLKLEIEEITNGLKQIQFNQDSTYENESPQKFQQQFLKFEAQSRQNDEFERKLQTKMLPKQKFASPLQESSSDSDDIEVARKLISIKKEQAKNKTNRESEATTRPQLTSTRTARLATTPSSKAGLVTSDLQRFNKQMDSTLHRMLASSQSYNLSLTQTQQNEYTITPQKLDSSHQTTPADKLRGISNLKSQKESQKSISIQSTPQPLQDRPKIYVQHDPASRCLFFKNDKESKLFENDKSRASLINSHADDQEIDSLIDSLNNKQSRSYFYQQEESRPRQVEKSKLNYDQNLYDIIHNIESPQVEVNQSLKPEQYQKYMDQYQKIVEQYDLQDETD